MSIARLRGIWAGILGRRRNPYSDATRAWAWQNGWYAGRIRTL